MPRILAPLLLLCGALAGPIAATASGVLELPAAPDGAPLPLVLVEAPSGGYVYGKPKPAADALGISPKATTAIVAALRAGVNQCHAVNDPKLNLDCLGYQFWLTARAMPTGTGYDDVRVALRSAADQMQALAAQNAAPDRKPVRLTLGGRKSVRALTPVADPARVAAQADAIIDATTLVLLRSAAGSDQRRAAFQEVAAMVATTKVLLRSS